MKPDRAKRPSLDIALEEMRELRHLQAESIESLDGKIGVLVGFLGVLLTLSIEKLGFQGLMQTTLSILFLLSLFYSLLLAVQGFRIKSYRFDPSPKVLIEDYMFRDPADWQGEQAGAKEQILADQVSAYNQNEPILQTKSNKIQQAMSFLLIGVLFFVGQYLSEKISWNFRSAIKIGAEHEGVKMPEKKGTQPTEPAKPNPDAKNPIQKGPPAGDIKKVAQPNPAAKNVIREGVSGDSSKTAQPNPKATNVLNFGKEDKS